MADRTVSLRPFAKELMSISLSLVWKDPYYAHASEPSNVRIDAETYVASRLGILTFDSVLGFHEEVLSQFFSDPDTIIQYLDNKRSIPTEYRDAIVAAEANYMIDYWESEDGEPNDYYRALFGLPPVGTQESDFIYNTSYADIDMTVPVHRLPYSDRIRLENLGYFKDLRSQDRYKSDKYKYLDHLGRYRIYPYAARSAEPYELLYISQSSYEYLRRDFIEVYEQCRRMVLRVYYNEAYRNRSHIYEGFLGMCMLFMTQQRMFEKYLEADISRDFYDLESLKLVYDAYSVPFYSSIPLKYHMRIVKRLNELISHKGSTRVFYDLFEIFDFGIMDAFEYFIVKERLTDEDGNPLFRDSEGNVLSPKDMWKLHFARIGWKDNKFVELTDVNNRVEYEELTVPDPYWIEDEDLQNKLYGEDWNYFKTKYMGVQIMFDLSELIFQTCYFLHELLDNRQSLSKITTYYNLMGQDIPIFDLVVYAVALMCRNAGYAGDIPSDPASVAAIYGYNFKECTELLRVATMTMDDFVKEIKRSVTEYVNDNEMLREDETLLWLIDHISDGAFNYLGDDFPYGEWGYAPPPVFLHDYWPSENSVKAVAEYLSQTIMKLKTDFDHHTKYEILKIYRKFKTDDDRVFRVLGFGGSHKVLIVKSDDWTDEKLRALRQASIASYEGCLDWLNRLLRIRRSLTIDPNLLKIIQDMDIENVDDVDTVYKHIEELDDYIDYKIQTSVSRYDYNIYADLRQILMTTKQMNSTFMKRNGEVASTYADLLKDINYQLYLRLVDEDIDGNSEEQYVLQTLSRLCDDITILEAANTSNINRIVNYLRKLLMFFKSAKVDVVKFNIIYLITDRGMNFIKFVSDIWSQDVTAFSDRNHLRDIFRMYPVVWYVYITQYWLDRTLPLIDKNMGVDVHQQLRDILLYVDELLNKSKLYLKDEFQFLFDWLHHIDLNLQHRERLLLLELRRTDLTQTQRLVVDASLHDVLLARRDVRHISSNFPMSDGIDSVSFDEGHWSTMSLDSSIRLSDVSETPVRDGTFLTDSLRKISEVPTP